MEKTKEMDEGVRRLIERFRKSKYHGDPELSSLTEEEERKYARLSLQDLKEGLFKTPGALDIVSLNTDKEIVVYNDGERLVPKKLKDMDIHLEGRGDNAHYVKRQPLNRKEKNMAKGLSGEYAWA